MPEPATSITEFNYITILGHCDFGDGGVAGGIVEVALLKIGAGVNVGAAVNTGTLVIAGVMVMEGGGGISRGCWISRQPTNDKDNEHNTRHFAMN